MKKLMKVLSFVAYPALMALSHSASAQTVAINGPGSSALFLQAGLGASDTSGAINAPCVWSGNNNAAAGNVVTATDTSVSPSATDFYQYIKRLIRAGFGKRISSAQTRWCGPRASSAQCRSSDRIRT